MNQQRAQLNTDQLNYILSLSGTAMAVHVGEEGRIQFASRAILDIWGTNEGVIGKTLGEALPELKGHPNIKVFSQVWREGLALLVKDQAAELVIEGQPVTCYFDFEYRPVKDGNGAVMAILLMATEVTELHQSRAELQATALNRELLMREQTLNEELAASNEELNAINEELSRSREELSVMNVELELRVQERVRAFAESEERFRSMAENTDVLIAVANQQGKKIYFNRAWSLLTGRTAERLIDSGWEDLIDGRDREEYLQVHRSAFSERISYTDEFRVGGADGRVHWMLKKGTPRFLSDGTFAGYISSCIDITDKKQSEQAQQELYEELATSNEELAAVNEELATSHEELEMSYNELLISEQRFRSLIKQAPVAICVIRARDLVVTEVNDGFLELVGKMRSETEGSTIWDAVAEAADVYAPLMKEVIDTGIAFRASEHELVLIRRGVPETVFVDFVYEPVKGVAGEVSSIMVVGNEVTDKVMARRSIEDVEERMRLAIEAAEIGTYDYNYKTGKLTTSDRFRRIFGFDREVTREEVIGIYHPEDAGLSAAAHESARREGGRLFYETRFLPADGELQWARFQGRVHWDSDGRADRIVGTVLDITAYKQLQQQKDDFISIASHELKTPITSLKASLQLLDRMKEKPSPLWPKLVGQATKSMQKISELVDDLLNVSKMKEGQVQLNKARFSLGEMLGSCCDHVRQLGTHELVLAGDQHLEVVADEHRIEQVVVNFVNNAIKYAPGEKRILLIVEDLGDRAKVSVRDTGPGIPAQKLPHLFDRYFRADPSGAQVSGLGLGLYISADIISRHHGEIGVDTEEGKGSTFWFTIPKE